MLKDKVAMTDAMDKRIVYGSERFTADVTAKFNIAVVIRLEGRPKNEKVGK
jgi:hypothetical protein